MNLKEYIKGLQDIAEQYPSLLDVPVAYSSDDKRSSFHPVHNSPTLVLVENNTAHDINLINYFNGDEEDIDNVPIELINAIIIN